MGSSTAVGLNDATQEELKSKHYLLTERGLLFVAQMQREREAWDMKEATA